MRIFDIIPFLRCLRVLIVALFVIKLFTVEINCQSPAVGINRGDNITFYICGNAAFIFTANLSWAAAAISTQSFWTSASATT